MSGLHETIHHAGSGFDDFALTRAVAAMRGVNAPDFSKVPFKEAVRRASEYWNGALEAACKPR